MRTFAEALRFAAAVPKPRAVTSPVPDSAPSPPPRSSAVLPAAGRPVRSRALLRTAVAAAVLVVLVVGVIVVTRAWGGPETSAECRTGIISPTCGYPGAAPTGGESPPGTSSDYFELDPARKYTATLSASEWQSVATTFKTLGWLTSTGVLAERRFEDVVTTCPSAAPAVPVSMTGAEWARALDYLCEWASQFDSSGMWMIADLLSEALGGPERVTQGFP